jgi:hypothetical protein
MPTQWTGAKIPVRHNLVKQYGPIGPAAIVAAVAMMKKRSPERRKARVPQRSRLQRLGT